MITENNKIFRVKVFDEFKTPIVDSKVNRKGLSNMLDDLKEKFA